LTNFDVQKEGKIDLLAELNLRVNYKIRHYTNQFICCDQFRENCYEYCYQCLYDRTEHRSDNLVLRDKLEVEIYDEEAVGEFDKVRKYLQTTNGVLNASNFTNLLLEFKNASYHYSKYIYDLQINHKPYYFLTIKASPLEQEESENIFMEKSKNSSLFNFYISDDRECKLSLFTHFNITWRNCYLVDDSLGLAVKTGKMMYDEGEIIDVSIFPQDVLVNVSYGDVSTLVIGHTTFVASKKANRILASYSDEEAYRIISVIKPDKIFLAWRIFVLGLVNYFAFAIFTRSSLLKWLSVVY